MDGLGDARIDVAEAPVRRRVEGTLRSAIVEGRLLPGTRLVELALCKQLSVSRPVLREAVRKLEAEGLISVTRKRGASVASITAEEARQIYEVRAQLEGLAVRGFVAQGSAAALRNLKTVLGELEVAGNRKSNGRKLLALKQRFYAVLLEHCGNTVVREMLQLLNNRINLLRRLSLSQEGRVANTLSELRQLVDAIDRRDSSAAYRACIHHVNQAAANALAALERRGQD